MRTPLYSDVPSTLEAAKWQENICFVPLRIWPSDLLQFKINLFKSESFGHPDEAPVYSKASTITGQSLPEKTPTNIHASSGILTDGSRLGAAEDNTTRFRQRGHYDR
jgi:hypothetical protein